MEKSQFWLNYNAQVDQYFIFAAIVAVAIIGLGWIINRLKLSQTTTAVIAFVAVRIPFMYGSLWYDEAFTAWLAGLPFQNMLSATAGDVHPPLWYIIEWATVHFYDNTDFYLRFPALILAGLVAWLHMQLCKRFELSATVTWLSFALLALLPFSVRYGAEARMYELLLALAMGLILTVEEKPSWGNSLIFGGLGALAMLTHNMAVVYVTPFSLIFFYRHRLSAWPVPFGWLIYMLWIPFAVAQLDQVQTAFWILPTTPGSAIGELHTLFFATPGVVSLTMFPVLLALIIYGAIQTPLAISQYALQPILVSVLLTIFAAPTLIARILIGVLPVLVIIVAVAIDDVWKRLPIPENYRPVAATLAGLAGAGLLVFLLAATPFRTDWRKSLLSVPVASTDTCYHMSPTSIILAARYVPCRHIMWPHASNLEQHLTDATKAAMLIDMQAIDDIDTGGGRLWLWWGEGPNTPQVERAEVARIKAMYQPVETYNLFDLDIVDYTAWRLDNNGADRYIQKTN